MNALNCITCGVRFGLDETVSNVWQAQSKQFYCPNGHIIMFKKQVPITDAETTKLRKENAELLTKLSQTTGENESLKLKIAEYDIYILELKNELEILYDGAQQVES